MRSFAYVCLAFLLFLEGCTTPNKIEANPPSASTSTATIPSPGLRIGPNGLPESTATIPSPGPVPIDVIQVYNDYHENEIVAKAKYYGKTLRYKGVVSHVTGKEEGDVHFDHPGGNTDVVEAQFPDGNSLTSKTGESLYFWGNVQGFGFLGKIIIAGCSLRPSGLPPTSHVVPVVTLWTDVRSGNIGRYLDKTFLFQGVVTRIASQDTPFNSVRFENSEGDIMASVNFSVPSELSPIKIGDTIRFRGKVKGRETVDQSVLIENGTLMK